MQVHFNDICQLNNAQVGQNAIQSAVQVFVACCIKNGF